MAIKHATLSAVLAPGDLIGAPEWDAGHVIDPGTIAFADLADIPTTMAGHGIADGITAAAVAAGYQPLSAVLTATTAAYTTAQASKLAAIAAGATANASDAQLRDRATHTGTQLAATISDFAAAADARVAVGITGKSDVGHVHAWADMTGRPTTIAAAGITDAKAKTGRVRPFLVPVSGETCPMVMGPAQTWGTSGGTAGRIELYPFTAPCDLTLTALSLNVTAAVAGALAKIVVYAVDGFDRPAAKILESGDLDCATIGVKNAPVSLTIPQDTTVWLGVRHSSTATLSALVTTACPDINGGAASATARKSVRRTLAYATAAPASWGWTSSELSTSLPVGLWGSV